MKIKKEELLISFYLILICRPRVLLCVLFSFQVPELGPEPE